MSSGFSTRTHTNRTAQPQKIARGLKFESSYLSSKNKGADQLCGYPEADLRLCFRICKKPVFPRCGSYKLRVLLELYQQGPSNVHTGTQPVMHQSFVTTPTLPGNSGNFDFSSSKSMLKFLTRWGQPDGKATAVFLLSLLFFKLHCHVRYITSPHCRYNAKVKTAHLPGYPLVGPWLQMTSA